MRGFTVWALWAALGLLILDAGLEAGRGRDRTRTPRQPQSAPTAAVSAMDGGDKIPPPTPAP